MGLLKFALVGNYGRFYNDLKEISKVNKKPPILMFADAGISMICFGSGLQDYLNYKFYEKKYRERKDYVTIGYMNKMYKTLAKYEYADFISNKINFHKNYNKFVKRECLSYGATYEDFIKFINEHEELVMKPLRGLGGGNVEKVITKDIEDKKDFYENMKKNECFIEELIIQNDEWGRLSPKSINTLRIMTSAVNGKAKIIFGAARIGSGKNITDNFHQGGMGVLIDLEKTKSNRCKYNRS